ncbi:MAG: hypothetical protein N5P05_001958 [Chroococcopsis gigantea SAG 12.99]|jgi:antitoxin PrlF|nr:hypothetical protein [Chlorogloea purpurea SAG 13.99]MDV3000352.1 hypothetical protein [Chroococcopsis gigantea SAG 12.99]
MTNKSYPISPAKIGNQDGFRLPRSFSKDYPHLVSAGGHIEVISENTLLVRLNGIDDGEDSDTENLMMSLFLDTLMKEAFQDPSSLILYTEEMSLEIDELLAGVTVEP